MKEIVEIKNDDKVITAEMYGAGTRILLLEDELIEKRLLDSTAIDSYSDESKNTLVIDGEEVELLINTRIDNREINLVYDKVNKRLLNVNGVNDVKTSYRLNLPYIIKSNVYGAVSHETADSLVYNFNHKYVGIDIDSSKFDSTTLFYLDLPGIGDKNTIIDIRKDAGTLSYKFSPAFIALLRVDGGAIKNIEDSVINTYLLSSPSINEINIYNVKLTDTPDYIYLPIIL